MKEANKKFPKNTNSVQWNSFFKKMKFQQNLQFIFDTFYLLTLLADKFSKEIFSHLT